MIEKKSGIYRIVCVKNGRYYFGSSVNIHRRWSFHKSQLRRGMHKNPIVQNVWNTWGEDSFRCELTEEVAENKLLDVEQQYLDEYIGKPNCMNVATTAKIGNTSNVT